MTKVEQRSRKPLRDQPAVEESASIPSPRVPAVEALPDDEIDFIPSPRVPTVEALPDDEVDSDVPATTPATTPTAEAKVDDGLSERERAILVFERQSWRHAGAKEQAIRDNFELSATRYYQLLNALLDNPAALAHDPVLVGRLRRLRGSRARARGR